MSKKDLDIFLAKVRSLEEMVSSLDKYPGRRELLTACESHKQVIQLAKSWGYDIGRRWGEVDS